QEFLKLRRQKELERELYGYVQWICKAEEVILAEERTTEEEKMHIMEARRRAAKKRKLKKMGKSKSTDTEEEEQEEDIGDDGEKILHLIHICSKSLIAVLAICTFSLLC
ncbi:hypothetical protein HHI36_017585, partial [Cryptolaemus montrouzieri]